MTDLLRSPRGKVGLAVAGGLLLLVAAWFLLVAPQRSKADDLAVRVGESRAELAKRRAALASPAASVTVKPSDLYRLTKALPNETNMAGILLDVNRLARYNALGFSSLTPGSPVLGTSFVQQPLAVVVQGRFQNVSRFLGDLRTLVRVRGGRLDARGRLYSVSKIEISAPDSGASFPTVRAAVTLNAYSFTPQSATPTNPDQSTSTDTSPSGTVAAGATP